MIGQTISHYRILEKLGEGGMGEVYRAEDTSLKREVSHYRILEKLGEGGMGEVYRAEDTSLKREVAIKVLPERFTQDAERLARFEREAQILASLNHPNVAAIHSFEHSDGVHFLAMELVEGETLAQRVAKGPLPVEEALEVFRQIAEGLEAAHESGVIHRDLKPANVNITPEGKVKILDFGLAKALEGEIPAADISHSPTRTGEMTSAGVILGTAAYMSPEQARGKPVDKRTDIWAFGCVLYEALTGRQGFGGETISDCIAKVLQKEPDWEALPEKTPWRIQDLLRRCLQKDPHDRLHHIADARIEISVVLSEPFGTTPVGVEARLPRSSWQRVLPWALLGGVAIVILAWTLLDFGEALEQSHSYHFLISPPETVLRSGGPSLGRPSISPDGRLLAFNGVGPDGKRLIFVRPMDSLTSQSLSGTEGSGDIFWSADSLFIGFFAGGRLKKIRASGGPAQTLCDVPPGSGTWNREGDILFSQDGEGIHRVSDSGGTSTPVTRLREEAGEVHDAPHFLPDGRHFLYAVHSPEPETQGLYVGSLDSAESKRISPHSYNRPVYAEPGYLLFPQQQTLMAQPFDLSAYQLQGQAVGVVQQLRTAWWQSYFSVSENGSLVYRRSTSSQSGLVWFSRTGKRLGTIGKVDDYRQIVLSPDETRLAMQLGDDIWMVELARDAFSRVTLDPALETDPVWSPDGRELLFASRRAGKFELFQKLVGGTQEEMRLFSSDKAIFPEDWSEEGHIVFASTGGREVFVLPLSGDREPDSVLEAPFGSNEYHFSPDGRSIAYNSAESGRWEVYVASFPEFGDKQLVSVSGGVQALWREDGRELFYLSLDGQLMATETELGSPLKIGTPRPLFPTKVDVSPFLDQYCVSGDGQRFLVIESPEVANDIIVVVNWFEELKRLVPTGE